MRRSYHGCYYDQEWGEPKIKLAATVDAVKVDSSRAQYNFKADT